MADPLGVMVYVVANLGFGAMASFLAGLSFLAYYRSPGQLSYALAGLGFSCIVLGGLVESAYTFVLQTDYLLSSSEFLFLQAGEDLIVAVGLGLLFLGITKHDPRSANRSDRAVPFDGEQYWELGDPFED